MWEMWQAIYRKGSLNRHIKILHLQTKDYICEKCDKQFTQKCHLIVHMKTVHLKTKDYICEKCDKRFTQKGHLNAHMKSFHLKVKDYICEMCNIFHKKVIWIYIWRVLILRRKMKKHENSVVERDSLCKWCI